MTNAQFLAAYPLTALYQDSAGMTATKAAADPIGLIKDSSGNAVDFTQATAGLKPLFQATPSRAVFDGVDDKLTATIPVGGIDGTIIMSSTSGTVGLHAIIPAGAFTLDQTNFTGPSIIQFIGRDGRLTNSQIQQAETYCAALGGGPVGISVGPFVVPSGITLTVPDGMTWRIL